MKTKSMLFCLVLSFCTNTAITVYAQAVNKQDSLALVDLYNSTNGPGWASNENWLTGPVSTWYGVEVTGTRVTEIFMLLNSLKGSIPSSIGNLTELVNLGLEDNQLSGSIPPSIGNLTNLHYLNVGGNQFSGKIPSFLGNLVNLKGLWLYDNQFKGSIPSSLSNLVNLTGFSLASNQLSGSIPSFLGSFLNFDFLDLSYNNFSGSIPSSIGNLLKLQGLNLSHNRLSGEIPATISNLSALLTLDLSYNRFTFNAMELVAERFTSPFDIYAPQARIPIHQNGNALSVSAGGTLSHNTYKWYRATKTGRILKTVITGDSVFHPSHKGVFFVRVTNSIATQLTLVSDTIHYVPPAEIVESGSASSEKPMLPNDKTNRFFVYPNPARDILHIQASGKAVITLMDQSGKVLLTDMIEGNGVMNVASLPGGLYYLKNTSTGATQKVVITR
jgi:hypothetical protein